MTSEGTRVATSVDDFFRNLADSGVSAAEEARTSVGPLPASAEAAAKALVASGALTAFQADAVLKGEFAALRKSNYDVLDRLGAGGMGTVFKARHRRMKRVVALKVLSPEVAKSASFAQRFQREVETIAKLSHPNVVMAYDADEDAAGPFLVMEFVDGRDLASEVARDGPLSPADAVDCTLQAARGLECAHAHGIVHRDIKPANLMRDHAGVVKVADLGLARLSGPDGGGDTSITQAGGVVGTLDYMAPEQALDSTAVSAGADIYSLGCTLHFLLTGRAPYTAGSLMGLLLKHREAPIPSLCEARPAAPAELDAIFRRMVAKDAADRFTSMSEVVGALEGLTRTVRLDDDRPAVAAVAPASASSETSVLGPASGSGGTSRMFSPSAATGEFLPLTTRERVAGKVVVLVEPSRTQAGIVRRYLQQLGIDAVHATGSGVEALGLAKLNRANVIVSSMHLSDMTGVALAHALLADPTCEGIGFVLATSATEAEGTESLPIASRFVQMPKPFDIQRLLESIAAVTG